MNKKLNNQIKKVETELKDNVIRMPCKHLDPPVYTEHNKKSWFECPDCGAPMRIKEWEEIKWKEVKD